jgi:hypothetical protein
MNLNYIYDNDNHKAKVTHSKNNKKIIYIMEPNNFVTCMIKHTFYFRHYRPISSIMLSSLGIYLAKRVCFIIHNLRVIRVNQDSYILRTVII